MIIIRRTRTFERWLTDMRDFRARERIATQLERLEHGLLGDVKSVGGGVSELRIRAGPGYRVYFTKRGNQLMLLLCGGDKRSQAEDIVRARKMAAFLETADDLKNP